jgi:hypothetical protein
MSSFNPRRLFPDLRHRSQYLWHRPNPRIRELGVELMFMAERVLGQMDSWPDLSKHYRTFLTELERRTSMSMKANILLEGDIGTGKTTAFRTLLPEYMIDTPKGPAISQYGLGLSRVGIITLEPNIDAALGPNLCTGDLEVGIHVHNIPPLDIGWDIMVKYAKLLNTLSLDKVLETTDPDKPKYRQFLEVFETMADFTCDLCGRTSARLMNGRRMLPSASTA